MGDNRIKNIIEALLIVSEKGLSREDLKKAITDSDMKDIEEGICLLKEDYSRSERAFNIAEIAGKYCIVTQPEYMPWISNLYQKDVERLTGPSLETLAIIVYKQPVTRAEVENVRGVNVGGVIKTLLDKDLIKVKGRKEVIGRPLVYGTTEKFLEIFGLKSLEDLPILRDFSEEDLEYGRPQKQVVVEESPRSAEDGPRSMAHSPQTTDDSPQDTNDGPHTEAVESGQKTDTKETYDEAENPE
ncbi:MAG: SMC-Scp complex subunit ScpB [Candidatus Omnitrophota bacterium]|nr:SMC-Scp complex subunit ScpB [Candidatus Omnitrophota bacterium]